MHTFNIALKNGNRLAIPTEYYPRISEIIVAKENLFCFTPTNKFKAFLQAINRNIFNPYFAVLSIINLSLCAPLLIKGYTNNQGVYYSSLLLGFIICYYVSKFFIKLMKNDPMSIDGLAEKLGYISASSTLKSYDEHMFKAIITINRIQIPRKDYFFDDLYGIIFDVATSRRLTDIFGLTKLRLVK